MQNNNINNTSTENINKEETIQVVLTSMMVLKSGMTLKLKVVEGYPVSTVNLYR